MTFRINDASAGGRVQAVWVTITENGDGTLGFSITRSEEAGDVLRLFFDVADESVLNSLKIIEVSGDIRVTNDSVTGQGYNASGEIQELDRRIGIEIGSAGSRSCSFAFYSTKRDLTLQDLAHVDFAVRLTTADPVGGPHADAAKVLQNTSGAPSLADLYAHTNAFRRKEDGSWICIELITIEHPKGRVQVWPGTILTPGAPFMGIDLAHWLEERRRLADPDLTPRWNA